MACRALGADEEEARREVDLQAKSEVAKRMEQNELHGEQNAWKPREEVRVVKQGKWTRTVETPLTLAEREAEKEEVERTLPVYVKTDVVGSLEAFTDYLHLLPRDEVMVDILRTGHGPLVTSDVDYAKTFKAVITTFGIDVSEPVRKYADQQGVIIRSQNIIYRLMDDVRDLLSERLPKSTKTVISGVANVQQLFPLRKKDKEVVAGCTVKTGTITKKGMYQVVRNGATVWVGALKSLRHFKDEVPQIEKGNECGILLEWNDLEVGDIIQHITVEPVKRTFDDSKARSLLAHDTRGTQKITKSANSRM